MKNVDISATRTEKTMRRMICLASAILMAGSMTACAAGNDSPAQREPAASEKTQQDAAADDASVGNAQQDAADDALAGNAQLDAAADNSLAGNGQISLDDAKQAALADAGLSASDVTYTKEKLDYEDGTAVYDIEFYMDNTEYEYEINAATGKVYHKSIETHPMQAGNGQGATNADDYISIDDAKAAALAHAGFTDAEVSTLKTHFDIDDGQAEYEVEFYKDGREYEYKINAVDGSIMEYDLD